MHRRYGLSSRLLAVAIFIVIIIAASALILLNQTRPAPNSLPRDFAGSVANVKCGNSGVEGCKYLVHLPTAYDGKQPFPLLLAFQPLSPDLITGTAADFRNVTGLDQVADRLGFIVIYPDRWGDSPDTVKAASALLDNVTQHLRIDTSRVYAAGQSAGGLIPQRLACHLSARIAGIAIVTTFISQGMQSSFDGCRLERPVAVLAITGANSESSGFPPPDVGGWAALDGCSASPTVSYQPSNASATSWPPAYGSGEEVRQETYGGCSAGVSVVLYIVAGSNFPSQSALVDAWIRTSTVGLDPKSLKQDSVFHSSYFDAGELLLSFFQQHHRS